MIFIAKRADFDLVGVMQARISPKVNTIHAELRQRVVSGVFALNEKLPTETELAAEFNCSLGTIAKAMALLSHEGLVERRTRAGTRVIANASSRPALPTEHNAYAFIYPSEQHEGIWRTVRGFQAAASQAKRRVVTLSTGSDYDKEAEYLSRLSEFAVKGAVLYPIIPTPQDQVQLSRILVNSRFPVVLADLNLPGLGCPSVMVDGFHAGHSVTRHLLQTGLRRIGFLANHSWAPSVTERQQGYLWAMEEAGQPIDPRHVLLEPSMRPNFVDPLKEPTELGLRYLEQAAKLGPDGVQAVVCANDHIASGLIRAAEQAGIRIPIDLKVIGIDGFALPLPSGLKLTSYHVPFEEIGRRAFESLDTLLTSPTTVLPVVRVRGQIIVHDSA